MSALASTACAELSPEVCPRPETEEPTVFKGGSVVDGVYMSSAMDGEWLHWPPGAHYSFVHHLGHEPEVWIAYLSFSQNGEPHAMAAGNQAEHHDSDADTIRLINATCAEYYMRLVAW